MIFMCFSAFLNKKYCNKFPPFKTDLSIVISLLKSLVFSRQIIAVIIFLLSTSNIKAD